MKPSWLAPIVWYAVGRPVVWITRTRTVGAGNIPEGGAVLAGNHVSYMDPVLLWAAVRRPVHFMAKVELWRSRFLAWVLPRLRAFPVNRGEADRAAITRATDILKGGGYVGIFPEGTRSADGQALGSAQGGAAFVALRAGVPVVPVAFVGTEAMWPKGAKLPRLKAKVTISFGEPIDVAGIAPDAGRKERVAAVTEAIMSGITAELERVKGAQR